MILDSAPRIDQRTASDVAQELQALLRCYVPPPGWNEVDPTTGAPMGLSAALIGVAARFAEIIIQRLNQVPQKNFLAFLELTGAALLPPQPARVAVTFMLAKGSLTDSVVPAATQVAAPPAPGEKDPVIYETENELVATAAELTWILVREPEKDSYADYSNDILTAGSAGTPLFHGNTRVDHVLYIGQSQFFSLPGISNLSLTINLQSPAGDALSLKWELWTANGWIDITPADPGKDGTRNLQQSGTIQFGAIPQAAAGVQNGFSREWLRCRLTTPITPLVSAPRSGMARSNQLPKIRNIGMKLHLHEEGLRIGPPMMAFFNIYPIDLTRDFYPFGEKPRFNDTFWMSVEEAFSIANATVTLTVIVTSPPGGNVVFPRPAQGNDNLQLRWEVWNGAWTELGTSTVTGGTPPTGGAPFTDGTKALTQSGDVTFTLPANVTTFNVNGHESFWLRVRIVSGNYGVEGHYELITPTPAPPAMPYKFVLPNFTPPSIKSITVKYDSDKPTAGLAEPDKVLAYNDSRWTDVTASNHLQAPFAPFRPAPDTRPTAYFGFTLPAGRTAFPNTPITLFFRGTDLRYGERTVPIAPDVSRGAADPSSQVTHKFFITNPGLTAVIYTVNVLGMQWAPPALILQSNPPQPLTPPASVTVPAGQTIEIDVQVTVPPATSFGASDSGVLQLISANQTLYTAEFVTFAHAEPEQNRQLRLTWEYWDGQKWALTVVRDGTSNFITTGAVEFLPSPDFAAREQFGNQAWWLRVRWDDGDYDTDPRIDRILLNTTMASQTITIRNEILGASDGSASQSFKTTRAPVLAGQTIEVREPEMPSGEELDAIIEDEGDNAISVVTDAGGRPVEIWVRWHEVSDFYGSGPRSRHYTLDNITGAITFGDGLNGLIPPLGTGLRAALYKTGGGARGNRAAGSIVQLKTTLPYIDKVINHLAAGGGAEAESPASLVARAPTELRHRRRCVTKEDYEDMARLASPDVVRALCVPNRDLVADPTDQLPLTPGNVSLIIVPGTADPAPQPGIELVRRVQNFISASSPATATVLVAGPLYLRVNVQAEIGLASLEGAGTLAPKIQNTLAAFLHPLTGGFDGSGWEFGRKPHRSDLYRLLKAIPEIDHIRSLSIDDTEDFPGTRETGRFLVYSGTHNVTLVFEPS